MNLKDNYLFLTKGINDILHVIFPTFCVACKHILHPKESLICTKCRHELPVLSFEKNSQLIKNQFFTSSNVIVHTSIMFRYQKDSEIQSLIHYLKYKNPKKLGKMLAYWHVNMLKNIPLIDEIDLIVPVPMHAKRQKNRGYNQVSDYAKTLAQMLNVKYSPKVLTKIKETKTQSKQNRNDRFKNMLDSFDLNPETNINNKHILLVDDVITTGATIQACITSLQKATNIKVSIAAIAITLFDEA